MSFFRKIESDYAKGERRIELIAMFFIALFLLGGLVFVYFVKTQRPIVFSELEAKMTSGKDAKGTKILSEIVHLKDLSKPQDWLPYLTRIENEDERNFAAEKLTSAVNARKGNFSNISFLGSVTITQADIDSQSEKFPNFKERLEDAIEKNEERKQKLGSFSRFINDIRSKLNGEKPVSISILGGVGAIKKLLIIRLPNEFRNTLIFWSIAFFGSFFGLHFFWRWRKFDGDGLILPSIFFLCGIGFLMMISLRDPLRDDLIFIDFTIGVLLGTILMAIITSLDFIQCYYKYLNNKYVYFKIDLKEYAPIILSIFLSFLLILFGSTPGTSDAKVNLWFFQPSEIIRILFAIFVAYFLSERWEYFRFLKAEKIRFMPRWKDVFPVSIFVFASIGLFILQKDLGPSLMMLGLFLILFAVVRKKTILSIIGLSSLAVIYFINYKYQLISITAADRCKIWLDPWNTEVLGGEQIVHSIWSFASGKFWGTGLGLGDPNFAPANHTDLILSSIGEEFGFIGILLIFAVYGILFYRCYVVARNSYSQFTYFLTLGLSSINALQLLFICSGVLGFLPLSGVISPFLSWGKTSMICNFISFAIILVISSQNNEQKETDNLQLIELKKPTKFVYLILAACGFIILGKTFMVQVWNGDENLVKGVIAPVPNEKDKDGLIISKIRRMKYNPRISEVKGELPFGSIYDRNEIPLASSNWDELQKFKDKYAELGVDLEHKCKKGNRCYPFGSKIFHLIGNSFTKIDKDPTKTNQIEIDFENVLRGYNDFLQSEDIKVTRQKIEVDSEGHSLTDEEGNPKITEFEETRKIFKRDYRELLPLLRNRYNPLSIEAYVLKNKNRNVKTTFDIGLQLRLTEVLKTELKNKNLKGSIVVLEPKTGDLLADVNFPFPDDELNPNLNADLQNYSDRARTLTVPPGSTFKVVTAIAALKRDVNATTKEFECIPFNDGSGRVGNFVRNRQVRDMKGDPPHGKIKLKEGLIHSCNAYFAQLGENVAGANELNKTASLFGIETTGGDENKNNVVKLNEFLPQASFGQGQIEASVFQIAKVYATVANNGVMPFGRWITDENNDRTTEPQEIISSSQAEAIADGLHGVVTSGTAQKALGRFTIQIAGKTGTAENGKVKIININGKIIKKWVDLESHSWFAGFAPFNNPNKRIAFAVLVENGGAGGGIAAKIAGEIVKNANDLRIIE